MGVRYYGLSQLMTLLIHKMCGCNPPLPQNVAHPNPRVVERSAEIPAIVHRNTGGHRPGF